MIRDLARLLAGAAIAALLLAAWFAAALLLGLSPGA